MWTSQDVRALAALAAPVHYSGIIPLFVSNYYNNLAVGGGAGHIVISFYVACSHLSPSAAPPASTQASTPAQGGRARPRARRASSSTAAAAWFQSGNPRRACKKCRNEGKSATTTKQTSWTSTTTKKSSPLAPAAGHRVSFQSRATMLSS